MKRFLFILSAVLTAYCSTADRFHKWQEDDTNEGLGLYFGHAFTYKRQEALLWLNDKCSLSFSTNCLVTIFLLSTW